MAITKDDIVQAAEAIEERGESPTLAAVRRELGGGSYTTISEVMQAWRAERQAAQARSEVIQVPEVVRDAMQQAAVKVWTEAVQLHGAQLAAERKALQTERERIEGERREAAEVADQISRELEREREQAKKMEAALEAERQAHTTTRTALVEAQAQAGERAKRIEAQASELERAHEEAAKAREEAAELRGRLAALETAPAKPAPKPRTRRTRAAKAVQDGDK